MTIHAFRIVKARYAPSALSGEGAREFGGRWNSPGRPAVYASSSVALAMMEMLVHLQSSQLLLSYVIIPVTFDRRLLQDVDPKDLPDDWRVSPPPTHVQSIGDAWLASASAAVLRVPSAVVPEEFNYLLNPLHPDFPKIGVGKPKAVTFDTRLK